MKQMVRSQSDNFSRFDAKLYSKSQILYPSPQKRNISLEFKLKITNPANEKPSSPDSSSKMSSLNSIDEFEVKSPLKLTKSSSNIEKINGFSSHIQRKEEELNYEELRNLRNETMNPHEKNFVEHIMVHSTNLMMKTKEINETPDEEEEDEKKEQLYDFDRFLNDIDDK